MMLFYRAISVPILHRITMVIPNELDKLKAWIIYTLFVHLPLSFDRSPGIRIFLFFASKS